MRLWGENEIGSRFGKMFYCWTGNDAEAKQSLSLFWFFQIQIKIIAGNKKEKGKALRFYTISEKNNVVESCKNPFRNGHEKDAENT